jgi:hypothetical protein
MSSTFVIRLTFCLGVLSLAPVAPAQPPGPAMKGAGLVVGNVLFGPADAILRYTGAGDFLDAIVPAGREGIDITCCATFGPDDHLYVSNPFGSSVLRFDGLTGAFIDVFVQPGSGGLQIPLILLFHEGHLYVGDPGAHEIHRYDAMTGSYVDAFVQDHPDNPLRSGFYPQHFAFGADGHLYVAGESSDRVLKYDGVTGTYVGDLVSASDGFPRPSGITAGPNGRLYVGSVALGEIRRFDVSSGAWETFVEAGSGGLNLPVGFVFGPDGHLYTTSLGTGEILAFDGDTGAPRGVLVPAGRGGLNGPRTLAINATVRLCHDAPGKPARRTTLTIPYTSGLDHIAHGDVLGAC